MKTSKQIAKRLALNTETLRTLAGRELELVAGAAGDRTDETGCVPQSTRCPQPPPQPIRSRYFDTMTNCL